MPKRSIERLLALFLLLFVACSGSAHAYIDPNAGGLLFQLLAPLFAAVVGAWLFLRRWIADFFRRAWRRLSGRGEE
ncbi:hypothetical protein [Pelomonas sp. SE-A7]|uniref:hypothetical protein n=1 Tax=Pelomonas sp. SE-A7 TaxID=3054953 RepID=UPI00259D228A|nr:hypothetical protein [Pelomonas sp. SE-A7]MDM4767534.1 hypothetical protein [Pelomonas sp. SE-A7]